MSNKSDIMKEVPEHTRTPKVRFPEYRNAEGWEETELQKIAAPVSQRAINGDGDKVLSLSGEHGIVLQSDYFGKKVAGDNADRYIKIIRDDFVYNDRTTRQSIYGTIKRLSKYEGGIVSPIYKCFRFNREENSVFWEWYFESGVHEPELGGLVNEGARAGRFNISIDKFLSTKVGHPKLPEQQKIAECLTSLDELIDAHGQKLDALEAFKKGLMQRLFPQPDETVPRLRFPEFQNGGEWKEMSIQDMIDQQLILGHLDGNHGELYPRSEDFTQDKDGIPYISANDFVNGAVNFSDCKRLPIQRARLFKKGVAKDGDILFAHNATVGPVAKLNTVAEFVILSTTATYFRCNGALLLNDFLKFSLTSPTFIGQYSSVMSQSTRNQVPITMQRKLKLFTTNFLEQQRIASCLSAFDDLIAAQTQKLDALKTHKRGLMHQLFPSSEEALDAR